MFRHEDSKIPQTNEQAPCIKLITKALAKANGLTTETQHAHTKVTKSNQRAAT